MSAAKQLTHSLARMIAEAVREYFEPFYNMRLGWLFSLTTRLGLLVGFAALVIGASLRYGELAAVNVVAGAISLAAVIFVSLQSRKLRNETVPFLDTHSTKTDQDLLKLLNVARSETATPDAQGFGMSTDGTLSSHSRRREAIAACAVRTMLSEDFHRVVVDLKERLLVYIKNVRSEMETDRESVTDLLDKLREIRSDAVYVRSHHFALDWLANKTQDDDRWEAIKAAWDNCLTGMAAVDAPLQRLLDRIESKGQVAVPTAKKAFEESAVAAERLVTESLDLLSKEIEQPQSEYREMLHTLL